MVKILEISKLDEVMKIWLEENIEAHSFVSEQYWIDNFAVVRELLPQAEILVYEDKDGMKGFIGITEKTYIAGLFVSNRYQSNGIGSILIEKCKHLYPLLRLNVYAKNAKAISFYRKHGFEIEQENVNDDTNEKEYSMIWKSLAYILAFATIR